MLFMPSPRIERVRPCSPRADARSISFSLQMLTFFEFHVVASRHLPNCPRAISNWDAPGIQHFVCGGSGNGVKDEDLEQQSRGQFVHSGRRDSGIHHHQAGFSGVHR
jgi:hypothetical protein